MDSNLLASIYALSSVLTFSTAAIGFTWFSRKVSPLWMNLFKCMVSFLVCVPVIYFTRGSLFMDIGSVWPFLVSGLIGLNIGDWFLLMAYKKVGPGRTLILFGFQPFIVGTFSWYFWGEKVHSIQVLAILFFVLCLFLFSYERFKKVGAWELSGLLLAIAGVLLDSVGVLLTRFAFDQSPEYTGIDAMYFRSLGALVSFLLYVPFVKVGIYSNWKKLNIKEQGIAVVSSFFGTFLSLALYLQAVKIGQLATVTSVVLADPVFSTFLECVWLRTWPSRYLWMALGCFLSAVVCLTQPHWGG